MLSPHGGNSLNTENKKTGTAVRKKNQGNRRNYHKLSAQHQDNEYSAFADKLPGKIEPCKVKENIQCCARFVPVRKAFKTQRTP